MELPDHIIENIERRWAAKLQQEVDDWRERKHPRQSARLKVTKPKERFGPDRPRWNRVQHPA